MPALSRLSSLLIMRGMTGPAAAAVSSHLESDGSWEEDDYSDSGAAGSAWRSGAGGAASVLGALREVCATCEDALNEAGGDYISFELQPEYRLKLRKRTPLVTLGLTMETHAGYELVAKRGTQDVPLWKVVRRVVAAPERGEIRVHSVALPLGMLAVEGTLTHDLRVHKSRLSWRLCAAWDVGLHKLGRKHRLPSPLPRVKPALRWDVRTLAQPELEGQLGDSTGVQYDIGRFHVSLPTVQATIDM